MQSKHRVVINTVFALCCSGLGAMSMSIFMRKKFNMEDIQNATLAGGVAVGSSSDLVVGPYGAMTIGFVAGIVSCIGFAKLKELCYEKLGLHDSCGVQWLHGVPGVMGAIGGAISASRADSVT